MWRGTRSFFCILRKEHTSTRQRGGVLRLLLFLLPLFTQVWKVNGAHFAMTQFYEVRTRLGPVASCLWWKGSSRPSRARGA
jgi:hypothetical protein